MSGDDQLAEVARLRAAALAAVGELAGIPRWTVVGADTVPDPNSGPKPRGATEFGPDTVGTFRGYGVDVTVGMSATAQAATTDPDLPLAVLIAAWLRGSAAPGTQARARLVAVDTPAGDCAELGARLRAELDADPEPHGLLVVADGARTLSTSAPGYFDEIAPEVQRRLDAALDAGDRAGLRALDPAVCERLGVEGRAAYQVLAGVFAPDAVDPAVRTYYRDAPFGVGYHVSVWRPRDDREGRAR